MIFSTHSRVQLSDTIQRLDQSPHAKRGYLELPQAGGSIRLPFTYEVDVRQYFLSKTYQALISSIVLTIETVSLC